MASYLGQCTNVCGSVVRSMTPFTGPVLCDPCRPIVKAREAQFQREAEAGAAAEAAKAEKAAQLAAAARAADKASRVAKAAVKQPEQKREAARSKRPWKS